MIVGGSERGVVAACSYEARKFGVHSAMPSARAKQLCPQAIFVSGTRGEYGRYSKWVTNIIASQAPLFEKASVDEFYLDLTGIDTFFNPLQWTINLRQQIINETRLPISFGLANNKMVAKIATNEAKPNGFLQVPAGYEKKFLAPLAANKIPGVGDHTYHSLQQIGISTIGDLYKFSADELEKKLGKWASELWNRAQAKHHSIISSYHEAKSISTENTFHENVRDLNFLMSEIVRMTEKVSYELRQERKIAGCVSIKIRYPDFETSSRQTSIPYTSSDDELIPVIKDLFHRLYKKGTPVRLLGVRLSNLSNEAIQTNIFSDVERKKILYKAIDGVKNRFGKSSLHRASSTIIT